MRKQDDGRRNGDLYSLLVKGESVSSLNVEDVHSDNNELLVPLVAPGTSYTGFARRCTGG